MPTRFRIDTEKNVVYRTIFGETSAEELLDSYSAVLEHPDYRPGMKSLTDMREVTPSTYRRDVLVLAQFVLEHRKEIGPLKVAVVVSREASFGMTRELTVELDESPVEMSVFRGIDAARAWLGLSEEGASTDDADAVAG